MQPACAFALLRCRWLPSPDPACLGLYFPLPPSDRFGMHTEGLGGVRRSGRQKQEPLKWWLNEKKEFGREHQCVAAACCCWLLLFEGSACIGGRQCPR